MKLPFRALCGQARFADKGTRGGVAALAAAMLDAGMKPVKTCKGQRVCATLWDDAKPTCRPAIWKIITSILLLSGQVFGAEWVITSGGLSPDKKLAVVVFPQKTELIDEADGTVLLIDQVKGRRIGPLEEVSSSGGTWGTTTKNVRCTWSQDGTILIVNFRTGRLMHSSQIYWIQHRRAIPLSFPPANTHPKGRLLEGLGSTANPGSEVSVAKDGTILRRDWGYVPDFSLDYSKHGLAGFQGELLFHYRIGKQGQLLLHDITVPAAL